MAQNIKRLRKDSNRLTYHDPSILIIHTYNNKQSDGSNKWRDDKRTDICQCDTFYHILTQLLLPSIQLVIPNNSIRHQIKEIITYLNQNIITLTSKTTVNNHSFDHSILSAIFICLYFMI